MQNNNVEAVNSSNGTSPAQNRGFTCIEALESLSKPDTYYDEPDEKLYSYSNEELRGDPDEEFATYESTDHEDLACEGTQAGKWHCNRLPRSSSEFVQRQCEDIIDENGREYTVSALLNDLLLYMITNPNRWNEFMEASFSSPDTIEDGADTVDSDIVDETTSE